MNFVLIHCFHLVEKCHNIIIITASIIINVVILCSKFAIWILVHQICATLKRLNTIKPFSIPHRLWLFTISIFILNSTKLFFSWTFSDTLFFTLAFFLFLIKYFPSEKPIIQKFSKMTIEYFCMFLKINLIYRLTCTLWMMTNYTWIEFESWRIKFSNYSCRLWTCVI